MFSGKKTYWSLWQKNKNNKKKKTQGKTENITMNLMCHSTKNFFLVGIQEQL